MAGELGGIFVTQEARLASLVGPSGGASSDLNLGGALALGWDWGIVDLRVGALTLDLGRVERTTGVMASLSVTLVSF